MRHAGELRPVAATRALRARRLSLICTPCTPSGAALYGTAAVPFAVREAIARIKVWSLPAVLGLHACYHLLTIYIVISNLRVLRHKINPRGRLF